MRNGAIVLKLAVAMIFTYTNGLTDLNALSEFQLSEDLKVTEIENDIYLVTHSFPWPGNSLLVLVDESEILWIDTPYTPDATALVLNWVEEELGEGCSITEINTGFHIDNLGGNQELRRRNIPIYGSELTCELLDTKSGTTMSNLQAWLRDERFREHRGVYSDFEFYGPTITFDINQEQYISMGSEDVIIYYPGPTHSYDNLVVYIPGKELLFGGCMILSANAETLGYIEDGNIYQWSGSLGRLEERFTNIRIVIPGHGNPGDSALITHTREVVDAAVLLTAHETGNQ